VYADFNLGGRFVLNASLGGPFVLLNSFLFSFTPVPWMIIIPDLSLWFRISEKMRAGIGCLGLALLTDQSIGANAFVVPYISYKWTFLMTRKGAGNGPMKIIY
jgi:hypothetical protein